MGCMPIDIFLQKQANGEALAIDIREKYECDIVNIEVQHLPMSQVIDKRSELPQDKDLVFICKTGQRAEALADMMQTHYGFKNAFFLEGGILGYIQKVDPSLPVY